ISHARGDRYQAGIRIVNIAEALLGLREFDRAELLLAEAREYEYPLVLAYRSWMEAAVYLLQHRFQEAVPAVRETIVRAHAAGIPEWRGLGFSPAAWVAAAAGRGRRAGELIGAADRLFAETTPFPVWEMVSAGARAAADEALGRDLADALARGGRLRTDEAV